MPFSAEVSPPVHLHRVLTAWQVGAWTTDLALAGVVVAGVLYAVGVRRLAARGRRWSPWRAGAFGAGLIVLVVAVASGLASYDDSVFTVHVAVHLLLMMVAPPLLALGGPVTLAAQASPRPVQTTILRVLHTRVLRALSVPLGAAVVYCAGMYADLLSSFYPYSLAHPLVHDASHAVMFWLGCAFWWPVLAVDRLPRRPSHAVRLAALVVGMPFEAFLGIALMTMHDSVASAHTVSDTHTGGALFWVATMAVTGAAAAAVIVQWTGHEERRTARLDRAATPPASEDAWAAAWLARTGSLPSRVPGPGAGTGPPVPGR